MTVLDVVPASIGQRLVWFLEHYRSEASSISCPALFRLRGGFDEDRIPAAMRALVARHESLRTTLGRRGRQLVQQIHDQIPVPVQTVPLTPGDEAELTRQLNAELASTIPIEEAPVRVTLWRLGDADRVLCVNMHHLISDAWSCGVVVGDVVEMFTGPAGRAPRLAPVGWQYREFTRWQHEAAASGELAAHQDYWNTKLQGMQLPELPNQAGGGALARPQPALATVEIPGQVGDTLRGFARAERTTLFSVFLALYYLLLYAETGQADLTVASFFANRTRRELRLTVGFLANMLALRTRFDPAGSLPELVGRTRHTVMDAVVHQAVPTQMLPLPSLLHSPGRINDVVFQMLPDRSPESWDPTPLSPGVEIDTFRPPQGLSRFGLNLTIIPRSDRVEARLSYAANQFPLGWAEQFLARYAALAATVLDHAKRPLTALLAHLEPASPVGSAP